MRVLATVMGVGLGGAVGSTGSLFETVGWGLAWLYVWYGLIPQPVRRACPQGRREPLDARTSARPRSLARKVRRGL
jgi:hypothetical protein